MILQPFLIIIIINKIMKTYSKYKRLIYYFSIGVLAFFLITPLTMYGQRKAHPKHKAKAHHHKAAESHIAHHHYRHLPKRGAVVKKLPNGLVTLNHKGARLHYHNGVFYKAKGAASFVVVKAPVGLRVKALPPGHKKIVHGKRHYLYHYGTFYTKTGANEEYEVVEPPLGAEVESIPDGYNMEEIDGVTYYTLEDIKYMEKEKEGKPVYEIVK